MHLSTILTSALFAHCYASVVQRDVIARTSDDTAECHYQYFVQNIDHSGRHNGTFAQRFSLNTEYYKPGGPIFWFQGSEGAELECVNNSIALAWAKELGGAAAVLEHRYFGPSKPFGASDPMEQPDKFEYLTLDNVMEDVVVFVESLKANLTGGADSKVIVTGCSYPGWLVAMYRQNRPETFHGAIASAAPVEGWDSDSDRSRDADYNKWTNNLYQQESYQAWENIRDAYTAMQTTITDGDLSKLQASFSTCDAVTNETAPLVVSLVGAIHGLVAQYNTHFLRNNPVADPFSKIVEIALSEPDPLQILNRTLWTWYEPVGLPCLNLSDPAGDALKAVPAIEASVFRYIVCTYMPQVGASAYAASNSSMFTFGPVDSTTLKAQICKESFNVTAVDGHKLRQRYKFTRANLVEATRILWVGGEFDPTSAYMAREPGVNLPPLNQDINIARFLSVPSGAHCEDHQFPKDGDKPTVKRARRIMVETIRGWLA